MPYEEIPHNKPTEEALPAQPLSLEEAYRNEQCPNPGCSEPVPSEIRTSYYGFCSEDCLDRYTENDPTKKWEVGSRFQEWFSETDHENYLKSYAAELGLSLDEIRDLHDVQGLNMANIHELVEKRQQKRAA